MGSIDVMYKEERGMEIWKMAYLQQEMDSTNTNDGGNILLDILTLALKYKLI
jgi:hypothetical protein